MNDEESEEMTKPAFVLFEDIAEVTEMAASSWGPAKTSVHELNESGNKAES